MSKPERQKKEIFSGDAGKVGPGRLRDENKEPPFKGLGGRIWIGTRCTPRSPRQESVKAPPGTILPSRYSICMLYPANFQQILG